MQGVLAVFGLLPSEKTRAVSPTALHKASEAESAKESQSPVMHVKFEEEPYEDEDWFLVLLSELVFGALKLEKPPVELPLVASPPTEDCLEDENTTESAEPDFKQLLVREGPIDRRFPLMDQLLMPQTTRKALLLSKWGLS